MTRPKRFRGMELTEDDVDNMVRRHLEQHYEPDDFGHYPLRINTVYARAKRLLPLWRKAGLSELQGQAYNLGRNDGLARRANACSACLYEYGCDAYCAKRDSERPLP